MVYFFHRDTEVATKPSGTSRGRIRAPLIPHLAVSYGARISSSKDANARFATTNAWSASLSSTLRTAHEYCSGMGDAQQLSDESLTVDGGMGALDSPTLKASETFSHKSWGLGRNMIQRIRMLCITFVGDLARCRHHTCNLYPGLVRHAGGGGASWHFTRTRKAKERDKEASSSASRTPHRRFFPNRGVVAFTNWDGFPRHHCGKVRPGADCQRTQQPESRPTHHRISRQPKWDRSTAVGVHSAPRELCKLMNLDNDNKTRAPSGRVRTTHQLVTTHSLRGNSPCTYCLNFEPSNSRNSMRVCAK